MKRRTFLSSIVSAIAAIALGRTRTNDQPNPTVKGWARSIGAEKVVLVPTTDRLEIVGKQPYVMEDFNGSVSCCTLVYYAPVDVC